MAILPRPRRRRVQRSAKRLAMDATWSLALSQSIVPDEKIREIDSDETGIGFDLSIAYGTSAAHFGDGRTKDLAIVEANVEYQRVMQELSRLPEPAPLRIRQRVKRWFKKKIGRPATPAIGVIGRFIQSICEETDIKLAVPVDKIVVSAPPFPSLTQRDINDAIEYAGLRSWSKSPLPYQGKTDEHGALLGQDGHAQCNFFQDADNIESKDIPIEKDELYISSRDVLSIYKKRLSGNSVFDSDTESLEINEKVVTGVVQSSPHGIEFCAYIRDHKRTHGSSDLFARFSSSGRKTDEFFIGVKDNARKKYQLAWNTHDKSDENEPNPPAFTAARGAAL